MDNTPFDLNLLRVFQAVYLTRNVSRAGELIGLSQPAVSRGLLRLRLRLRDPLFRRAPGGVAPTPRADRFARSVEAALGTIDFALADGERFEPLQSQRRFAIHMSDLGEGEFLPPLMHHLRAAAPGLRIEAVQLAPGEILAAIEQGRIDLALGYLPQLGGTHRRHLFDDHYVVLTRRRHPRAARLSSRAALQPLEFVLVNSHAEPARALHRLGLDGQVRLTVPHFSALPEILARTDLAAIMPGEPARRFAERFDLHVAEPALGLPPLRVCMHWYGRAEGDAGHRWLREAVLHALGGQRPAVALQAPTR